MLRTVCEVMQQTAIGFFSRSSWATVSISRLLYAAWWACLIFCSFYHMTKHCFKTSTEHEFSKHGFLDRRYWESGLPSQHCSVFWSPNDKRLPLVRVNVANRCLQFLFVFVAKIFGKKKCKHGPPLTCLGLLYFPVRKSSKSPKCRKKVIVCTY